MKCPKCGFVSYPGLAQCKKCGHRFSPVVREESSSRFSRLMDATDNSSPDATMNPVEPSGNSPDEGLASSSILDAEPAQDTESAPLIDIQLDAKPPLPDPEQDWREELAGRVASFRRRRARLKQSDDASSNLELDFDDIQEEENPSGGEPKVIEFPQEDRPLEAESEPSLPAPSEMAALDTSPLEKPEPDLRILNSAAVQAGELTLDADTSPAAESEPMEITVGAPEAPPKSMSEEATTWILPMAPIGRRFVAGLVDTLVLMLGASLFALIFWRAGGHLRPDPLDLAVVAFIASFFILFYFGLFTALASTTPGLLWVDCEIRNFEGAHPTTQEAFLRAFGYLVSTTAFMLGFLWALLDSEGLTWHDRMSGTFVASEPVRIRD